MFHSFFTLHSVTLPCQKTRIKGPLEQNDTSPSEMDPLDLPQSLVLEEKLMIKCHRFLLAECCFIFLSQSRQFKSTEENSDWAEKSNDFWPSRLHAVHKMRPSVLCAFNCELMTEE